MTIKNMLLSRMKDIEVYHKDDKDGFHMMDSFLRFYTDLTVKERKVFWDIIFDWINGNDEWHSRLGIRLFVEIQNKTNIKVISISNGVTTGTFDEKIQIDPPIPSHAISKKLLDSFIKHKQKSMEWKNNVIRALLDVHYKGASSFAVKYIQKYFYQGEHHIVNPALPSLCHVDIKSYIDLTSKYLTENMIRGKYNQFIKNSFASFVINLVKERKELCEIITALMRTTRNLNEEAANELKELLLFYFNEPYIKNKFDKQSINQIVELIKMV